VAASAATKDLGTLTTTGDDNTGWGGPGIGNFYSGQTGRGAVAEPYWTVFTPLTIHGTSSGGDTLAARDYTVTFDAGWRHGNGTGGFVFV